MLRAVALAMFGTLVLACLLTPLVYAALELGMDEVPGPYSRVFDRVVLVVLIGWIAALRKRLKLARLWPYWREFSEPSAWRLIAIGAAFTLTVSLTPRSCRMAAMVSSLRTGTTSSSYPRV